MKKILAFLIASILLLSVGAYASAEPTAEVDAYTSASLTKTTLSGDELTAAAELLVQHGSDLATLADTQVPGYTAPVGSMPAQIMTVNPDGCVGLSTITEFHYYPMEDGRDQVVLELTYGQNAVNLGEPDARGTLLVRIDGTSYLVHLDVIDYDEQVYTDEAYAAGEFNAHYSGASNAFSSFTITCEVLSIETSQLLIFDF